ncbi:hypothetical protein [Niabella hirudinis]
MNNAGFPYAREWFVQKRSLVFAVHANRKGNRDHYYFDPDFLNDQNG